MTISGRHSFVDVQLIYGSEDFFQVVALSQPLDKALLKKRATREQVEAAIRGKVLGWGKWVCVAERTFKSS
jgi:hypothetical protein